MISLFQADRSLLRWADTQMSKLLDILDGDDKCHLCKDQLTVDLDTGESEWDYYPVDEVGNFQKLCYGCLDTAQDWE